MFAEDDIVNISKPVRTMHIILLTLPFVIMNSIFSRVSAHEKKAIRQLESIGKDLILTNAAVTFNQICIDNNFLPKFTNGITIASK